MSPTLLILGGTSEARSLAKHVAAAGIDAIYSYAGRVASPTSMPIPTRIGGYGGVEGLAAYLKQAKITHLIDATHPFTEIMSRNAITACAQAGVPLIALVRPPWTPKEGDRWISVPDLDFAVTALEIEPQRVFLAIGRTEIDRFAAQPDHHYLLRVIDPLKTPPPLPNHEIVVARGPFTAEDDRALMKQHKIGLVVAKNSGGDGAYAKIEAARALGLAVLMIERPKLPPRHEVPDVQAVMDWIAKPQTP